MLGQKCGPVPASFLCGFQSSGSADPARYFRLAFENLKRHTRPGMPADVAVKKPCARIVSLVGDNQVAHRGEHGGVASRRIICVVCGVCWVEGTRALGENGEVVAMEMDRVSSLDDVSPSERVQCHPSERN
jgi:hypothetical protein